MKHKELKLKGHTHCIGLNDAGEVVVNPHRGKFLIWDELEQEWWCAPHQGLTPHPCHAHQYTRSDAIALLLSYGRSKEDILKMLVPVGTEEGEDEN